MFKTMVAAIAAFFCSYGTAKGETFIADAERTIYFIGTMGPDVLDQASVIESMSAASKAPITLVINSPGGQVYPGIQVISAMRVAQARGVKFRCFVPVVAASMAFQLFATCDERFALRKSMLLWHPMKAGFRGSATASEMLYESKRLRALERPLVKDLLRVLKISPKKFAYHRQHETFWTAEEFLKMSPDFLKVVDDFKGVKNAFTISKSRDDF